MVHYYSEEQRSELNLRKFKAFLRGNELEFYSGSGVFSANRVDKGTEILVNNCLVRDGDTILDMGCGIGVIGIAIKKSCPECKVYMTDINKRAVSLAKMNAKLNKTDANILQGNLYEPVKEKKFDIILTNPPYSAGRELCYMIIEKSISHLNDGGNIQLVALHNKGGKMLKKKMNEIFGNADELVKKSGYRVYMSEKRR
jgi:16S rRNA (guanine1207-N2)-methyltransferase